jgi:hypothetical protein
MRRTVPFLLAVLWAAPAAAMTPPSVSADVVPRSALSGLHTPPGEGWGAGVSVWWSERDRLRSGTRSVDNPGGQRTATLRSTLTLDRSLGRRFGVLASVPYVRTRVSSSAGARTARGMGDAGLYLRYSLYRDRVVAPTREVQLLAGTDLPTGDTTVTDASGARLPATQQPGSDTADAVFGAALTWGLPAFALHADASVRVNGGAAYTFGDSAALNAGVNAPLGGGPWSVTAELNAQTVGRDDSALPGPGVLPDGTVRDSGGETVHVTPGLQWRPFPGAALNAGVQFPVHQDLRGVQLASEADYVLSFYVRFGVRGTR